MVDMGWCHEFGSQIRDGCGHLMRAGETSCSCSDCGVVCKGRFSACDAVWARGPRQVTLARPVPTRPPTVVGEPISAATTPPPVAAQPAAAEPVDAGRGEVLEWLRSAFDGVRHDLAMVIEAMGRQQQTLSTLSQSEATAAKLVELVEALPERVTASVAEIFKEAAPADTAAPRSSPSTAAAKEFAAHWRQLATANGSGAVDPELQESLAEVQALAAELRNEMSRLAAFRAALMADQPALAQAVDTATERVDGRLTALAHKVEVLAHRPRVSGGSAPPPGP